MNIPIISVIIPVHADHGYWRRALASVFNQTYSNKELIITVNSKDFPKEDLVKFIKNQSFQITIYDATQIKGVSFALNEGIKKSNGEFIAWLSSDDYWEPTYLAQQIYSLEKGTGSTAMSICGFNVLGKDNRVISTSKMSDLSRTTIKPTKWDYFFCHQITGCSALIKKSVFENIGFFNEKLLYTQDFDMWYRILENYEIVVNDMALTNIQEHSNRTTLKEDVFIEVESLWLNILNDYTNFLKLSKNSFEIFDEVFRILNHLQVVPYIGVKKIMLAHILKVFHDTELESVNLSRSQFKLILELGVTLDFSNSPQSLQEQFKRIEFERNEYGQLAYDFREKYEKSQKELNKISNRFIIKIFNKFFN
jgi:teichuronic acid biosynthesis glycosyltransferase TuaG